MNDPNDNDKLAELEAEAAQCLNELLGPETLAACKTADEIALKLAQKLSERPEPGTAEFANQTQNCRTLTACIIEAMHEMQRDRAVKDLADEITRRFFPEWKPELANETAKPKVEFTNEPGEQKAE